MTWGRCTTRTTANIQSNFEMDVGKIGAMIPAANTGQLMLEKCHTTKNCFDSAAGMEVAWLRKHLPQKALFFASQQVSISGKQLAGHWCGLSLFYLQCSKKVCRGQQLLTLICMSVCMCVYLYIYCSTSLHFAQNNACMSQGQLYSQYWKLSKTTEVSHSFCMSVVLSFFEPFVSGLGQANHPNCCNLMPHSTPAR